MRTPTLESVDEGKGDTLRTTPVKASRHDPFDLGSVEMLSAKCVQRKERRQIQPRTAAQAHCCRLAGTQFQTHHSSSDTSRQPNTTHAPQAHMTRAQCSRLTYHTHAHAHAKVHAPGHTHPRTDTLGHTDTRIVK